MADQECPKCEEGLPAYLATFADLMSLLMCFFVLLLSFAEIDAIRFKKMADSMKDAFGVQREIPANEIVKGVSVIKQEFSPSPSTEPTVINEIHQQTTDEDKENLDIQDARRRLEQETQAQVEDLKEILKEEIEKGLVEVVSAKTRIIVRIREKGSFPSGSASLDPGFFEVMDKISDKLAGVPGRILVAGHTDDIPIHTRRFRSNWELSAARAVTVAHALLANPAIDPRRVVVEGLADTRPLVPNDSREHRARNRRVELVLVRGPEGEDKGFLDTDRPQTGEVDE